MEDFLELIEKEIRGLISCRRQRTAEAYVSARNSFRRFIAEDGKDRPVILTPEIMMEYQGWLKDRGVSLNTVSFYMRILRAVYNRRGASECSFGRSPFKNVYTGVESTVKRALALADIKSILSVELDFSHCWARDLFMFSFYTRGMSFVDMAHLRKSDLQDGVLRYRRRKTGQLLYVKWEPCMEEIVCRYRNSGPYLLPILPPVQRLKPSTYRNRMCRVNRLLKDVAVLAGIHSTLTMYVARHSWASIAKYENIPVSVISEAMGHDSERTTMIYLASLGHERIDKANALILGLLS